MGDGLRLEVQAQPGHHNETLFKNKIKKKKKSKQTKTKTNLKLTILCSMEIINPC